MTTLPFSLASASSRTPIHAEALLDVSYSLASLVFFLSYHSVNSATMAPSAAMQEVISSIAFNGIPIKTNKTIIAKKVAISSSIVTSQTDEKASLVLPILKVYHIQTLRPLHQIPLFPAV